MVYINSLYCIWIVVCVYIYCTIVLYAIVCAVYITLIHIILTVIILTRLDMGFDEEVHGIISKIHRQRQTVLFSATMPQKFQVRERVYSVLYYTYTVLCMLLFIIILYICPYLHTYIYNFITLYIYTSLISVIILTLPPSLAYIGFRKKHSRTTFTN